MVALRHWEMSCQLWQQQSDIWDCGRGHVTWQ